VAVEFARHGCLRDFLRRNKPQTIEVPFEDQQLEATHDVELTNDLLIYFFPSSARHGISCIQKGLKLFLTISLSSFRFELHHAVFFKPVDYGNFHSQNFGLLTGMVTFIFNENNAIL
jgi:hypothetical protein